MDVPHKGRLTVALALIVVALVERYGLRHPSQGYTLSELLRWAFRTETPSGRRRFVVLTGAAALWLVFHILEQAEAAPPVANVALDG